MHCKLIQLHSFKSYEKAQLDFSPAINCITGANGSGKTNLLDALYCLALTRSAFSSSDAANVQHGATLCSVIGQFEKQDDPIKVQYGLNPEGKKIFKVNGEVLPKLSAHIGQLPLVFITPDDQWLIHEGSETRRKFADGLISQLDHNYLDSLLAHNHVLQQRNALLKSWGPGVRKDLRLLDAYDQRLLPLAHLLHDQRSQFITQLQPALVQAYHDLSGGAEAVTLTYQSQLANPKFDKQFQNALESDLYLQRTTMGLHRDDLVFELEGRPLKKLGSQGQQKTFVLALKLAQYQLMQQRLGLAPLLLLDDIFDKLDDARIAALLAWLARPGIGQVFITDARPERSRSLLDGLNRPVWHFLVSNGQVQRMD